MSEETNHIPETDKQLRAKKRKRRVRFAILYPAILIALSFLCFFLYRIADFVHVCRIEPGTTVVDSHSIKPYDPVFDGLFRSGKYPKLLPYLMYRHYVIPDGVTEIGESAFLESGCLFLRSVEIPGSVKKIGRSAFSECCNLTTIELPEGLEMIDPMAFRKCVNLKRVELPNSLKMIGGGAFAGCTALAVSDWSDVSEFGQAALAGIPATTLTLSSSATLGAYAFAADAATVATTLSQSALPAYDSTAFLGREVSYVPVSGSVTRIEASDLVAWLSDATASAGVTQPTDYNTATLKTWLSDSANAYAYAYADDLAADEDFIGLTVDGKSFIYTAPSDAALSISVEPVACYTLSSDESDWSADNLTCSDADNVYFATDTAQTSCFARLRFSWDW